MGPPTGGTVPQSAGADARSLQAIRGASTLARDFGALASGRLAAVVLSLVTVIFTTRLLGPIGYGTVAFLGVVATLVSTASSSWTLVCVSRYGRELLEHGQPMSVVTWNRLLIAAPLVVLSISVVTILKLLGALPVTMTWTLVAIAVATGLTNVVMDHWVALLEARGSMRFSAASQVLRQASYLLALIALAVVNVKVSATTIVALTLGSAVLFSLVVAPFVWTGGVVPRIFNRQLLRRMLWLSTPLLGLTISQYVFSSIDIVVLKQFRSQQEVGIYAVAYQAYTVLSSVAVSITGVLVPLFVSVRVGGREDVLRSYLSRYVPIGAFVLSLAGGLAAPLLPIPVRIVFGAKFHAASSPLAVLFVALTCLFCAYLVAPLLTLHEKTRVTALINGGAAVINVVADYVLIGLFHMGVIAPALATSAGLGFVFLLFDRHARKALDLHGQVGLVVFAPLMLGVTLPVVIGGTSGMAAGVLGATLAAAAVLRWRSPVTSRDLAALAGLGVPNAMIRALSPLARR